MLTLHIACPGENASFDKLKESAKDYELKINDVIDTLIRLGYIQDEGLVFQGMLEPRPHPQLCQHMQPLIE